MYIIEQSRKHTNTFIEFYLTSPLMPLNEKTEKYQDLNLFRYMETSVIGKENIKVFASTPNIFQIYPQIIPQISPKYPAQHHKINFKATL